MNAYDIGRGLGAKLAGLLSDKQKEQIRALFVAKFGRCHVCEQPLAGASPSQICEECHAGEVLAAGLGGERKGNA